MKNSKFTGRAQVLPGKSPLCWYPYSFCAYQNHFVILAVRRKKDHEENNRGLGQVDMVQVRVYSLGLSSEYSATEIGDQGCALRKCRRCPQPQTPNRKPPPPSPSFHSLLHCWPLPGANRPRQTVQFLLG